MESCLLAGIQREKAHFWVGMRQRRIGLSSGNRSGVDQKRSRMCILSPLIRVVEDSNVSYISGFVLIGIFSWVPYVFTQFY